MIMSLQPKIRGVILDMDGVIWRDDQPIGDLPAIFGRFDQLGIRCVLATNNATRSVDQYLEKISIMGVDLEPWQVINSGQAAAYLLHARFPQGGPVYIVGEEGLARSLVEQGFYAADKNVLAVVAGLDRKINYDKLDVAARFIRDGAIYIGTNPDATFPSPGGVTPGAGVILAALQTASGITPIIAGKPERAMFDLALSRLGTSPQETLAIGDRLETDTAGAQRVGCRAALVLSGVTGKAAAEAWTPRPDLIALDLTTLLG